jgi:addiction module RelB/DinJ family antitoxin
MDMLAKTIINFKTDVKLKREAQEVSRELGLPLGTIINAYLRDFVREKRVVFSSPPMPNKKTGELLRAIESDIKNGKNSSGVFMNYEEASDYLDSL